MVSNDLNSFKLNNRRHGCISQAISTHFHAQDFVTLELVTIMDYAGSTALLNIFD